MKGAYVCHELLRVIYETGGQFVSVEVTATMNQLPSLKFDYPVYLSFISDILQMTNDDNIMILPAEEYQRDWEIQILKHQSLKNSIFAVPVNVSDVMI